MKKLLYFDVETTGTNPVQNDIIQIAGIIIAGNASEEFEFKMQPVNYDNITIEALEVNKITLEQISSFPKPAIIYGQLIALFSKYIDRYDKTDKFTPIAYNGNFDLEFLNQFFIKNNDAYFGSWQNWKLVDPLAILRVLDFLGDISLPNYKLATVCEYFQIELNAHDARSDIQATRQLMNVIYNNYLKKSA